MAGLNSTFLIEISLSLVSLTALLFCHGEILLDLFGELKFEILCFSGVSSNK